MVCSDLCTDTERMGDTYTLILLIQKSKKGMGYGYGYGKDKLEHTHAHIVNKHSLGPHLLIFGPLQANIKMVISEPIYISSFLKVN